MSLFCGSEDGLIILNCAVAPEPVTEEAVVDLALPVTASPVPRTQSILLPCAACAKTPTA